MSKQEAIQKIKDLASEFSITEADLKDGIFMKVDEEKLNKKRMDLSEILYWIGGIIILFGIGFFIAQKWDEFGSFLRIFFTLGLGIAFYVSATLLSSSKETQKIPDSLFLISAFLIPFGISVIFNESALDLTIPASQSLIFAIAFVVWFSSYLLIKKNSLLLFSIIFGTLFFSALADLFAAKNLALDAIKFFQYKIILLSLSYLSLGYAFSGKTQENLNGFLYGAGLLGFFGSALALGGWEPNQNIFWELAFPAFAFAAIFISIYLKKKIFLFFGSFFLVIYIIKITSEYFADSIGWAMALILMGFALMAMGYLTFYLNKKYISK